MGRRQEAEGPPSPHTDTHSPAGCPPSASPALVIQIWSSWSHSLDSRSASCCAADTEKESSQLTAPQQRRISTSKDPGLSVSYNQYSVRNKLTSHSCHYTEDICSSSAVVYMNNNLSCVFTLLPLSLQMDCDYITNRNQNIMLWLLPLTLTTCGDVSWMCNSLMFSLK